MDQEENDVERKNAKLVVDFYTEASDKIRAHLVSESFTGRAPGVKFDREGFIRSLSQFTSAFPDGKYINDDTIFQGDKVVTVGRFEGTHKGEFLGIAPTGRKVSVLVVHVDRVSDGKIVEHLRMSDQAGLMKQLTQ
jgi:predicted ester cyclase